jgi:hypothetical protein
MTLEGSREREISSARLLPCRPPARLPARLPAAPQQSPGSRDHTAAAPPLAPPTHPTCAHARARALILPARPAPLLTRLAPQALGAATQSRAQRERARALPPLETKSETAVAPAASQEIILKRKPSSD